MVADYYSTLTYECLVYLIVNCQLVYLFCIFIILYVLFVLLYVYRMWLSSYLSSYIYGRMAMLNVLV